ncbi:MAG: hypothetical protein JO022_15175 [Acidobacteriaceae bacterium]|nr:hypothetical protein [Acidobacteriaceae bacterium]
MSVCARLRRSVFIGALSAAFAILPVWSQSAPADEKSPADQPPKAETQKEIPPVVPNDVAPVDKRVFGVLPNYRTAEAQLPFEPITPKQKFLIATKDSFDLPVLGTTAAFAALSQLQGSGNSVYGQGMKGFAYRYGISYVDQVIGNYFPEAIVPTLFHTDPRYFRKGTGSVKSRLWYAVDHIFICRNDNGNTTFNVNEFVGNGLASATGLAYHVQQRTLGDAVYQMGTYLTSDMIGQVAKEFWPDVKKHLHHKHPDALTSTSTSGN